MSDSEEIIEVDSSVLGTKDHWDSAYDRELECFKESGDVGEIWFGKSCLKTLCKEVSKLEGIRKEKCRVLDIGCGNGMTLIEMAKLGFKNLEGSDYSEKAIDLAKSIAEEEQFSFIKYFNDDISQSSIEDNYYDIIMDKGTFDAIALSEERDKMKLLYKQLVERTLSTANESLFIITSCNYTDQELKAYFLDDQKRFEFIQNVQYPVFKFGGSKGSSQTTLIFKKLK
ncbi:hypothetical protein DLAC_04636 [Tieghemostelium lacteum]|uniref:Protein-lysine N-methyltransferase DLAC_04636 n=1 Tax=Tieghemostelium lacteum TaxID=361077 RepID=A0A151ZKC7_TIELA|nr:hypothetical protein DLAC_04636 [Tieghemostelium lacteum]|eukprot:KYQ94340.1 hypothetical protein DLAC_04636 [Tieghemostelium lacteum]